MLSINLNSKIWLRKINILGLSEYLQKTRHVQPLYLGGYENIIFIQMMFCILYTKMLVVFNVILNDLRPLRINAILYCIHDRCP